MSTARHSVLRQLFLVVALWAVAGCGAPPPSAQAPAPAARTADGKSDPEKVRAADISILFVGNSHTMNHDLPGLIAQMIRFRHPQKTVYTHVIGAGHLDDAARDPRYAEEIDTRPWKFVVLQGQRISVSGKHEYSRAEALDMAKRAKGRGATVLFFSVWGLRDKAGDGARQDRIHTEMARAADVGVVKLGRAWDLALAERPELPLHEADGNHQSATGAFLTAAVFAARLTGDSPAPLAAFPYPAVSEADRRFLAEVAARSIDPGDG